MFSSRRYLYFRAPGRFAQMFFCHCDEMYILLYSIVIVLCDSFLPQQFFETQIAFLVIYSSSQRISVFSEFLSNECARKKGMCFDVQVFLPFPFNPTCTGGRAGVVCFALKKRCFNGRLEKKVASRVSRRNDVHQGSSASCRDGRCRERLCTGSRCVGMFCGIARSSYTARP